MYWASNFNRLYIGDKPLSSLPGEKWIKLANKEAYIKEYNRIWKVVTETSQHC